MKREVFVIGSSQLFIVFLNSQTGKNGLGFRASYHVRCSRSPERWL